MSRIKIFILTIFLTFFGLPIVSAHDEKGHDHAHAATVVSAHDTVKAHGDTAHAASHAELPIGKQVAKMILGHIGDNHDWDAFGHAVVLPLPVILYTKSQGLQFFMSSNFHHGAHPHNGFKLINDGAKIAWENPANTEKIYDFSLTKVAATLIIGGILMVLIFLGLAKAYRRRAGQAPRGFQNLFESIIIFMRDGVIKSSVGPRYKEFMPLLLTVFFFIFLLNVMGNIPFFPGGANASGNIAVTMVLALVIFLYVSFSANKYYWKHIFMPDVPLGMYIIMLPIELMGVLLRPFVLMLRLFANITAGHIIVLGFFSLIFIFGSMKTWVGYAVSPAAVGFNIFMGMLELLVAFLQAYVFTLLSALYIGSAIEEHGHHEEAHANEKH